MLTLTTLASGSSGNCTLVSDGTTHILVDAGISARRITTALKGLGIDPGSLSGVLVTHEHSDHIKGLGVMLRRYGLPVFATAKTIDAVLDSRYIGKVDKDLFHPIEADHPFQLDDITVEASHVWHDAADPVCYSFCSEGFKASIATDLGDYDEYLVEKIRDSHILFVEANHDVNMLQVGSYPYYLKRRILGDHGHLSNERCAQLIEDTVTEKTQKVYLGHLSKENNFAELAYETVKVALEKPDFLMEVAKRDCISSITKVS